MDEPPLLTVVVSVREGHSLALAALGSILADDAVAFELIYVDIQSPPDVARALDEMSARRGFKIVRHDSWIAPATGRRLAAALARGKYTIFIDNDVSVEPGSFQRLVACAEETGAALVGPLYLQVGADGAPIIHMAGGRVDHDADAGLMHEEHLRAFEPAERGAELQRRPVDTLEFHCLLARTDFAQSPGALSQEVLLVHDHIDFALCAKERGLSVWLEPAARITLQLGAPRRIDDMPIFRKRWDPAACENSIAAFSRRWPMGDADGFHEPVRGFTRGLIARARLFHEAATETGLDKAMAPQDLAQTRVALREQAIERGYQAERVAAMEAACDFATLLCDGLYRPDGRPFLNHVIGTASALVRYDLKTEIVLAGLLHAAYSHRPDWIAADEVSAILASGGDVDRIVRGLPQVKAQLRDGAPAARLFTSQAAGLCVEAANEADMLLSGEFRATGRASDISSAGQVLLAEALPALEVPGLALTAALPRGEGAQGPLLGYQSMHGSFRLDAANRRLEPVRTRV